VQGKGTCNLVDVTADLRVLCEGKIDCYKQHFTRDMFYSPEYLYCDDPKPNLYIDWDLNIAPSGILCYKNEDHLASCHLGTVHIIAAYYGKSDGHNCPGHGPSHYDDRCVAADVTDILANICNGQTNCHVNQTYVAQTIYNSPCDADVKHLEFWYWCSPEHTIIG